MFTIDKKKTTLMNLVTADLPSLDYASMAELYSIEQKLLNNSTLKNIKDVSADILINDFMEKHHSNSAVLTVYAYRKLLLDLLNNCKNRLSFCSLSQYLSSKAWSEVTKRRNCILFKRFLYHLFQEKYTEIDLSTHIKISAKAKSASYSPTYTQVKKLLEAINLSFICKDEILKYQTIIKLLIKSGLRRNEALNLNVENIDFETGTITIKNTKNKDDKVMPMDDDLSKLLTFYLDHFKYSQGPLFRGVQGSRLCKQSLMNGFHKIRARAGLPKEFKIHSLRRFFINQLRKNGVDIATIQKLAGHRDIRTTEIYCNISDEEKVKAIESIRV